MRHARSSGITGLWADLSRQPTHSRRAGHARRSTHAARRPGHARHRPWQRSGMFVLCVSMAVAGVGVVGYARFRSVRDGSGRSPGLAAARSSTTDDAAKTASQLAAARTADSVAANVLNSAPVVQYLKGESGSITAAVYNEVTGTTSLYRPGVAEDTASIMKVDILATLLAQSQASGAALTAEDQQLAQQMIEDSNDNDAQELWDAEGGAAAVSAFDATAGLTQTAPNVPGYWGLSTTTAADQVQLLKTVAYPNNLLTDTSRNLELGLMFNIDPGQAWGVSAGVPAGIHVALKNGWLPLDSGGWQINSMGFIDGDGRDYLIAVLTNGNTTEQQGINTIEGLSSLVWQGLARVSTAKVGPSAHAGTPGTVRS